MSLKPGVPQCVSPMGVENQVLDGSGMAILTFLMLAWARGSWWRGQGLLTFIAAEGAVFSGLTRAGLMATVLWIVNG